MSNIRIGKAPAIQTVLVLPAHVDALLERMIRVACDRSNARAVFWDGREETQGAPSLLIAALPRNQRCVPHEASRLMSRVYSALPALLLSNETLVRDPVVLQGGRVTLAGAPLSPEKLAALITKSQASQAASINDEVLRNPTFTSGINNGLCVRECRTARGWMASVWCSQNSSESNTGPEIVYSKALGFFAGAPVSLNTGVLAEDLEYVQENFHQHFHDGELISALRHHFSGAISLNASASLWKFFIPGEGTGTLRLFSNGRVPHTWNVSAQVYKNAAPFATLEASTQDIVAVTSGFDFHNGGTAFSDAAAQGSKALLNLVKSRMREQKSSVAAILAEVF